MSWRQSLKVEGIPLEPIRNIRTIRTMSETGLENGNSADTAYSAYRTSTPSLKPGQEPDANYFDRIYRRLDKFSGSGKALLWFQDHHPEECSKLTRLYFTAQKDPENKVKARTWALVELEAIRRHRNGVTE